MFDFFKKKNDPYMENVAAILHQALKAMLPLENAYGVAEECLGKLRGEISAGVFQDGENPDEKIMAIYCFCVMADELRQEGDGESELKCVMAVMLLKGDVDKFQDISPLEKGISLYGEHVISKGTSK